MKDTKIKDTTELCLNGVRYLYFFSIEIHYAGAIIGDVIIIVPSL